MAKLNDCSTWNKDITYEDLEHGAREQLFGMENIGFCIECGFQSDECEPDAAEYICDDCGKPTVYGACLLIEYWR